MAETTAKPARAESILQPHPSPGRRLACLCSLLIAAPVPGGSPGTAPEIAWQQPVVVATGEGHRGPWRMNESEFHYVDDPTVALSDAGIAFVAWADQKRQDIFLQAYGPDGEARLEEPVNVSRSSGTFSWLPRMVLDGDGEVHLLWQEIVFSGGTHGGEILFARSTDGGRSCDEPVNLSNTIAGAGKGRLTARRWHNGSLDLAMGPEGTLYAAWTEYEGALRFSRSTDGGESFSEPLHVAGGDGDDPARGPALAAGNDGVVHLAWAVGEDPAGDIHLASSDDGGRSFGEPRTVAESGGHSDAPAIAVDAEGSLHLVHAESPAGPFRRYHVRYLRSGDDGESFGPPRNISGAHSGRYVSINFPALDLGAADELYVLWELYPTRSARSRGLGFSRSRDGGRNFTPPVVVPGSDDPSLGVNGSQQGLLMNKLAVNDAGDIAVVNSRFLPGESSHVRLHRGRTESP